MLHPWKAKSFNEFISKQAIDMTFRFMICSEKNPLRICKHCGKVFYAKNPKAEYDSRQCRNQANEYKSRNKNKVNLNNCWNCRKSIVFKIKLKYNKSILFQRKSLRKEVQLE